MNWTVNNHIARLTQKTPASEKLALTLPPPDKCLESVRLLLEVSTQLVNYVAPFLELRRPQSLLNAETSRRLREVKTALENAENDCKDPPDPDQIAATIKQSRQGVLALEELINNASALSSKLKNPKGLTADQTVDLTSRIVVLRAAFWEFINDTKKLEKALGNSKYRQFLPTLVVPGGLKLAPIRIPI